MRPDILVQPYLMIQTNSIMGIYDAVSLAIYTLKKRDSNSEPFLKGLLHTVLRIKHFKSTKGKYQIITYYFNQGFFFTYPPLM